MGQPQQSFQQDWEFKKPRKENWRKKKFHYLFFLIVPNNGGKGSQACRLGGKY
jgi:hypothetical protein